MNLKERLRADLTASMKARDETRKSTLRMVLSAITNEEVSGDTARELTDPEVVTVLARELKKRRESAEAFAAAGRSELAEREEAESAVISEYMPQQLTDEELDDIVGAAIFDVQTITGQPPTVKQMGQVIKAAQAEAAGRADGKRISAAVKAALSQ